MGFPMRTDFYLLLATSYQALRRPTPQCEQYPKHTDRERRQASLLNLVPAPEAKGGSCLILRSSSLSRVASDVAFGKGANTYHNGHRAKTACG